MKKIKVFLCDDHQVFIDGLLRILQQDDQIELCGYALNGRELFQKIETTPMDILVTDIGIGESDGVDLARQIKSKYPAIKIIALTMFEDQVHIERMVSAGAGGYLFKSTSGEELIRAVKTVYENGNYFSSEIVSKLVGPSAGPSSVPSKKVLTAREIEILKLFLQEKANKEIADMLNISVYTVNNHRHNIMAKLNVKSTVGLIKFALENNLI
jgi:DNA-binding NarL/FixJ family response regulator